MQVVSLPEEEVCRSSAPGLPHRLCRHGRLYRDTGGDTHRSEDYLPARQQPSFSATVTALEKHSPAPNVLLPGMTGAAMHPGRTLSSVSCPSTGPALIRSTGTTRVPQFQAGETTIFTIDPLPGDCDQQVSCRDCGRVRYRV